MKIEQPMPDGSIRSISFRAAYDKRDPNPSKNYGIHCMDICFVLRKHNYAVDWYFFTQWYLKSIRENDAPHWSGNMIADGLGNVGYHSPVPLYENQYSSDKCDYTGGKCYNDGSGLASCELFDKFVAEPEVVWQELEKRLADLEQRINEQQDLIRNFS